ncbi:MAG: response regulator transcription factor [Lachnospiraceae bacterium]|nr:response regulator transcription factor [Lachnospiraceae bacterium]
MISVAIVENDKTDAATLENYVRQYAEETGEMIETAVFSSGILFMRTFTSHYNLVFMDIEMPGLNGIETARELREQDPTVILIFVTNMAHYALQGYSVGAMDYVLKPIWYPDIRMRLERVRQSLEQNHKKIVIPFQRGVRVFYPQEILYIDSVSHQITFHTTYDSFSTYKSMNYWEKELAPYGFARCNTSYIVNLKHCREVDGNTVKIGNEEIPISRARKKEFIKILMQSV